MYIIINDLCVRVVVSITNETLAEQRARYNVPFIYVHLLYCNTARDKKGKKKRVTKVVAANGNAVYKNTGSDPKTRYFILVVASRHHSSSDGVGWKTERDI